MWSGLGIIIEYRLRWLHGMQGVEDVLIGGKSQGWYVFQSKEGEFAHFVRLGGQRANVVIENACSIGDDDVGVAAFAVDAYELFQLNIQVGFFFDLANSGLFDLFAAIHIAAYKAPLTFRGIDIASPQQKCAVIVNNDDRYQFGFQEMDEGTRGTGEA